MIGLIFDNAEKWFDWAKDYYEEKVAEVNLEFIKKIYAQAEISEEIIKGINKDRDVASVMKELSEIGYLGNKNTCN